MRRGLWLAVAVVLVATVGLVTVKLVRQHQAEAQAAEQCRAVTDLARRLPAPAAAPAIAVLGDSYAEGMELPGTAQAWPFLAFPSVAVDAIGGTGYTTDGPCDGQSFQQRAGHVLSFGAPVIVVQGGLNDVGGKPAQVERAATELIAGLTASGSTVVLIGPAAAPGRDADAEKAVDRALEQAAEGAGASYVSTLDWPLRFGPDGVHMTADAHQEYARRVAAALP